MEKDIALVSVAALNELFFSLLRDESDTEEDTSDDEIEISLTFKLKNAVQPRQRIIPRCESYYEQVIPQYLPSEFQTNFRLTPVAFDALCIKLIPVLQKNNIGCPLKHPEKQILAVIWLLATPDSYRSVGNQFNMGKASLSNAFIRIVKALNELAPLVIKWPRGEHANTVMEQFHRIAGVIGAIDGTFVPIKAPQQNPEVYVTRKCNYAFTLQSIAEPSLKFTDSFIGYPGSVTDTRIFRNSHIYQMICDDIPNFFHDNFIIGDKAYPLLPWCIPPYVARQRLNNVEKNFNSLHSKTRQIIERSFALLFGRFRRLKFLDMNRIDLIPATVIACCVLHNVCLDFEDLLIEEYIREGQELIQNNNNLEEEIGYFNNENQLDARNLRDNIARNLYIGRQN